MAPTRTVKSKSVPKNGKFSKGSAKSGALGANTKSKVSKKSKVPPGPPPKQQKTKSAAPTKKKKKRVYTEKELGISKLNMITPVGVELPKGKKKGKVFVDDQESMMTILAIVNADKEGQIESKMMKARHMEEIREARRKEAEARQEKRNSKLEETKESLRKRRKKKSDTGADTIPLESSSKPSTSAKASRKRVSFA